MSSRATAAMLVAALLAGAPTVGAQELVKNGALTEGTESAPAEWRSDAWSPLLSRFGWEVGADGTGAISITSTQPNDARWCQTVAVEPGAAYRIAARVRTRDVGTTYIGAFVVIEPLWVYSSDLRGTHDWERVEFEARAGEESSWNVCAKLGSYSNLNTGTAWFTDFSVTRIAPPPPRPSRVWQAVRALAHADWLTNARPLVAALLLGYGLGILRRRRS